MLTRLCNLIRYSIAAKLYLLTAISIIALTVLATASIHFADQTKLAGRRVYQQGVVEIQKVSKLEVLFEQHRALITAAPAELDRGRLQKIREAVEALNASIKEIVEAKGLQEEAASNPSLSQIVVEFPKMTVAGERVLALAYNFAQDKALEASQGDYSLSANKIQKALTSWYQQQLGIVDSEASGLSKSAEDLTLWVIAAALTAFVMIGPVTLWAEHRILGRLGMMTAVMHRLRGNEITVAIPFTDAPDEIGDIARSIDAFKNNAIALGQAHLQLDIALNNMSQGLCFFDGGRRLIVSNNRYSEIYGIAPGRIHPGITHEEIVDLRFEAGNYPDMSKDEYLNCRQALVVSDNSSDTVTELKNGRIIRIRHQPMPDHGWVATHEDITEGRRREESFRLLFKNNPVPMWVYDRDTLGFMTVNNAAVGLYGYGREQFLTMTVPDLATPQDRHFEAFLRALPDTQNGEQGRQHKRADGTTLHVEVYSRTLRYEDRDARLVAVHDVTDRILAEEDLHRTKMFLDAVIDNVPMPIVVKTAKDSRFTLLNKAGEELFGFSRELIIGKTPHDVYDKNRADMVVAQDIKSSLSDQPLVVRDQSIQTPGRGVRIVNTTKVTIQGDDEKSEYLLTLMDDVTERRKAEQRIEHLAHSDSLTDLPNRAAFNERLTAILKLARAEGRGFAILCMDLDEFKEVNDVYGHIVGDLLLCRVADRLRAVADGVFIARLGGDEFTIIADIAERPALTQLTDRLLAAFVADFEINGHRLRQR